MKHPRRKEPLTLKAVWFNLKRDLRAWRQGTPPPRKLRVIEGGAPPHRIVHSEPRKDV